MIKTDDVRLHALFYGYVSSTESVGNTLQHEVLDWTAQINRNVNISTQKDCVYEYGSLMCGAQPPVKFGTVVSVGAVDVNQSIIIQQDAADPLVSATVDPALMNAIDSTERYRNGKLRVYSGQFAGMEYYIRDLTETAPGTGRYRINLTKPHAGNDLDGQLVALTIGCRKTFDECKLNSGGLLRFNGYPSILSSVKVYTSATSIP